MARFPFWLKLSFLHPAVSVLLLSVAYLAPEPPAWGAVGYFTLMLGFLLNLPGVAVVNMLRPMVSDEAILVVMILFTWGCVVVPVCFGLSRLMRWRKRGLAMKA